MNEQSQLTKTLKAACGISAILYVYASSIHFIYKGVFMENPIDKVGFISLGVVLIYGMSNIVKHYK